MFSKSCKYSLRASISIAKQTIKDNKIGLRAISEKINSSQAFTAKILWQPTQTAIVKSIKDFYDGFKIEKEKMNTKFSKIVSVSDGTQFIQDVVLGLKQCQFLLFPFLLNL